MLRSNRNTIEGERAGTVSQLFFSDGLFEKGMEAGRDVLSFWRKVYGTPSPRRIRMPTATAFQCSDSQLEPRFILELQEHVKHVKCYLTHGLEGLIVGFFLHKDEMLECNSGIVVDQVHSLKKRAPWDSLDETPPLLCTPTIMYFKPVSPVSSAPCTRCGRRVASKEKKSVGSWFVAESASPLGGELS